MKYNPLQVIIVGNHPHRGERGHIDPEPDGDFQLHKIMGVDMALIHLHDSPSGIQSCYAKQSNISLWQEPTRRRKKK